MLKKIAAILKNFLSPIVSIPFSNDHLCGMHACYPISYPEPAIFRGRIESSGIIHNRKPEILAFFARLLHSFLYQQPIRLTQIHVLSQSSRFFSWRSRARGTRLACYPAGIVKIFVVWTFEIVQSLWNWFPPRMKIVSAKESYKRATK